MTPAVPTVSGFKRGLEAEKIIGATNEHSELMFLMKHKKEVLLLPYLGIELPIDMIDSQPLTSLLLMLFF